MVDDKSQSLFLAATTFPSIISVLGTPTTGVTDVTTYAAPPGFKASDVMHSADASPQNFSLKEASAAAQYWVCVAVSQSTFRYGWSQGDSESSALQNAKNKCGEGDCDIYSCVEEGCVGLDFGSRYAAVSYASGYGGNDGSQAANKALSTCRQRDIGCAQPGYFCAQYIR